MKHAPRVVAEHPSGAARHGGNATFLPCAPHVPPPSPTTQNTEGGGVWAEHLRWATPESVALCLGAFTCLYRSGWARRVRPGSLIPSSRGGQQDYLGRYLVTVSVILGHLTAIASHFQHMACGPFARFRGRSHFVREEFSQKNRCCFLRSAIKLYKGTQTRA